MRARLALLALLAAASGVPAARHPLDGPPDATADLATPEGVALVRGTWRWSDTRIVEVDHRSVGPDLRPSGPPNRTHDLLPHAGGADFDDSGWETIEPAGLRGRRSTGRLSFAWYRIRLTVPERVGTFDPTGATVVLEIVVDDYAEVWVDGRLPQVLGQTGGHLIGGWNAPNRLVVARGAKPGQQIQLAILGINGPLSEPPGNFVWVRSATLDFYRPERAEAARPVPAEILRHDPAVDAIVPRDARVERVAEDFLFTEGPIWAPDGYLLFSDPNNNTIHRWTPDGRVSVFRSKSGYAGFDVGEYGQPGSNGLTLDRDGRLTICEHGNRRVTRLERNGSLTVLADRYRGRRLNSPNDLVYRSDGMLCFSDPPFGLPKLHADPRRELDFSGVFCLVDGRPELVTRELEGPNGLAFSPDEKLLYVTNWDVARKVVMRYRVGETFPWPGEVFFDMTREPGEQALDGVKVDREGNLYVSGPGGLWILSAAGTHLGTIRPPELPANMAWGDADGRTLYLTARAGLYRVRLAVPGIRP